MSSEGAYEVKTSPHDFEKVKEALVKAGLKPDSAEITMIPKNTVDVDESHAKGVLNLMEALEDNDDVQHAYANFNIAESILKKFAEAT